MQQPNRCSTHAHTYAHYCRYEQLHTHTERGMQAYACNTYYILLMWIHNGSACWQFYCTQKTVLGTWHLIIYKQHKQKKLPGQAGVAMKNHLKIDQAHTHTHTRLTSLAASQQTFPTPPSSSSQPILVCCLSICNRFSKAAKTMGQKFLGCPRTEATRAVAPASRLKIFFE